MAELWAKYKYWFLGSIILVSALVIWLNLRKVGQKSQTVKKATAIDPENKNQIIMGLIKQTFGGTEYEEMIPLFYGQAFHETNGFKSRAYLEQNNLFGMKEAQVRQTTDLDTGLLNSEDRGIPSIEADEVGYSDYKDLADSCEDLLFWLEDQNFKPIVFGNKPKREIVEEYANELKKRKYFEAPVSEYVNGIMNAKL